MGVGQTKIIIMHEGWTTGQEVSLVMFCVARKREDASLLQVFIFSPTDKLLLS